MKTYDELNQELLDYKYFMIEHGKLISELKNKIEKKRHNMTTAVEKMLIRNIYDEYFSGMMQVLDKHE